jgi:Protein of unknown function (DUF3142)
MRQLWRVTGFGAMVLIVAGLFWTPTWSKPPRKPLSWKTGFWVWAGDTPVESNTKPDLLYVQVPGARWPDNVPEASQYVMVRRVESPSDITPQMAEALAAVYSKLRQGGPQSLIGLQIDYDCATSRLADYASFLRNLHDALPPDTHLSITALLDWFRPGTRIQDVVDAVDEFVPQFYDAGSARMASGIAEIIDAEKWAPVFNALGAPYRIGISSFGRIARRRTNSSGAEQVMYFRDARPLDFAGKKELNPSTQTTDAGEVVVHYTIDDSHESVHSELAPRDRVDITFPTTKSVRSSYEAVRRFGGYCAGAIFFRWPSRNETLAFTADQVMEIVGGTSGRSEIEVETRYGECASLRCADVYLRLALDPAPTVRNVYVRPNGKVEMFLPEGPLRAHWRQSEAIRVNIPAYSGLRYVYLGRALSHDSLQFEVMQ